MLSYTSVRRRRCTNKGYCCYKDLHLLINKQKKKSKVKLIPFGFGLFVRQNKQSEDSSSKRFIESSVVKCYIDINTKQLLSLISVNPLVFTVVLE